MKNSYLYKLLIRNSYLSSTVLINNLLNVAGYAIYYPDENTLNLKIINEKLCIPKHINKIMIKIKDSFKKNGAKEDDYSIDVV